jgi:hypothetical protein
MNVLVVVFPIVCALVLVAIVRELFLGYPKRIAARALSAKDQAVIAACADALFPPSGPIPLSGTEAGLVAYMDRYVGSSPANTRALMKLLFWFLEHGTWVFGPRRGRFSSLTLEARIEALRRMSVSRIYFRRIAFLSMRTMLTMGYLANPKVAVSLGMRSNAAPFEAKAAFA